MPTQGTLLQLQQNCESLKDDIARTLKLVFRWQSQGCIRVGRGGAHEDRRIPSDRFLGSHFDLAKKSRAHFEFSLRGRAPMIPLTDVAKGLSTPLQFCGVTLLDLHLPVQFAVKGLHGTNMFLDEDIQIAL